MREIRVVIVDPLVERDLKIKRVIPVGIKAIYGIYSRTCDKESKAAFPKTNINYIMESLDLYGQVENETSKERVQLAILKLSEGDYDKFIKHIHHAKIDSRDIFWPAEEPNLTSVARNLPKMTKTAIQKLQELDRKQNEDWLNK